MPQDECGHCTNECDIEDLKDCPYCQEDDLCPNCYEPDDHECQEYEIDADDFDDYYDDDEETKLEDTDEWER
jgi:hypothetical protein